MIGCCVHKQPIIALYFEFETVLKFYNLEARSIDPDLRLLHKPCNIGPNLFTLYKVCKGLGIYEKMAKPSQRFAYLCLDNDKMY